MTLLSFIGPLLDELTCVAASNSEASGDRGSESVLSDDEYGFHEITNVANLTTKVNIKAFRAYTHAMACETWTRYVQS